MCFDHFAMDCDENAIDIKLTYPYALRAYTAYFRTTCSLKCSALVTSMCCKLSVKVQCTELKTVNKKSCDYKAHAERKSRTTTEIETNIVTQTTALTSDVRVPCFQYSFEVSKVR
jgi:hypothetical protein